MNKKSVFFSIRIRHILMVLALLAIFMFINSCDFLTCDQPISYSISGYSGCESYCAQDPGCTNFEYTYYTATYEPYSCECW